jgi:FkbM family methyltransferase
LDLIENLIKRVFQLAGFEIHRRRPPDPNVDPFLRQQMLLSGVARPIIFDVGANIGDTTKQYRSLFPSSIVYAFEPYPESYAQLVQATHADPSVFPQSIALGSETGKFAMQANVSSVTNSFLETDETAVSYWGPGMVETLSRIEVEVSTLEAFCQGHQIDHVDILKLDTQGTETRILRGANQMLREARINLVYTEILMAPTYKGQGKVHEMLELLEERNYVPFSFYNPTHRKDGRLLQVDAIFVKAQGG